MFSFPKGSSKIEPEHSAPIPNSKYLVCCTPNASSRVTVECRQTVFKSEPYSHLSHLHDFDACCIVIGLSCLKLV
jgi:hypothetical protein